MLITAVLYVLKVGVETKHSRSCQPDPEVSVVGGKPPFNIEDERMVVCNLLSSWRAIVVRIRAAVWRQD